MNRSLQRLKPRAFNLIFAASIAGLTACSAGTEPGNTNVESGGPKDKNPTEHNDNGKRPESDTTNTVK